MEYTLLIEQCYMYTCCVEIVKEELKVSIYFIKNYLGDRSS